MKHSIKLLICSALLLIPIFALGMAIKPLSLEEKIKQTFTQKVAALEARAKYLKTLVDRDCQTHKLPQVHYCVSSYSPNSDQEWEMVVVD